MISAFIQENHTTWDAHIAEFAFAYNTAIHEATRASPAFLNYGRHPELPDSKKKREDRDRVRNLEAAAVEHWHARMEKLDDFRAVARENTRIAQDRQQKYYNVKRRSVEYCVGDKVWAKNRLLSSAAMKIAAKLSPKFAGPFIVTARLGMNSYQLSNEEGQDIGKVAVCDLRPCHSEDQCPDADEEEKEEPKSEEELELNNLFSPAPAEDISKLDRPGSSEANSKPRRKRGRPKGKKRLALRANPPSPRRLRSNRN
ncbi:uncharacterized protein LOC131675050 [Phymastichus coffea]|uniref:uncharacterized protein LOC131675050 n=1 Tax=Phymastichus coffea TaxID=108790 RepID=UPI00273AD3CE|nr:uncharacterized protein LOC131675050 [Phymastichus coffea]